MPMFLHAVRRFTLGATGWNGLFVCITTLILSGVSDLNLILLLPALCVWQLCVEWPRFRSDPVRFLAVYLFAALLVLGSFSEAVVSSS